jgi:hypothetical protein
MDLGGPSRKEWEFEKGQSRIAFANDYYTERIFNVDSTKSVK